MKFHTFDKLIFSYRKIILNNKLIKTFINITKFNNLLDLSMLTNIYQYTYILV